MNRNISVPIKPYKVGDIVFSCLPLIHCIKREFKGIHCDYCLERSESLKKCTKCCQMYYCEKDCQQKDWEYHKYECKVFSGDHFHVGAVFERLLLRLYLCSKLHVNFATKKYKTYYGEEISLNDLQIEGKSIFNDQQKYDVFCQICATFNGFDIPYDRKQLLNWYVTLKEGRLLYNLKYYPKRWVNYSLFGCVVGCGLFLQKPYDMSHSCTPNTQIVTNGLAFEMRAIKDINCKMSTPVIKMALIELDQNKEQRAQMLKTISFKCKCDKCDQQPDKDLDYTEYKELLKSHKLHWSSIGKPQLDATNSEYIIDENLFLYMRAIYGEYDTHISEALVLSFICFASYSNHSSKSLNKLWYEKIEPIVQVTHGSDHPLYKLFVEFYSESI